MQRKNIQPKTLSDPRPRYAQAIQTIGGKLLFIAGQTASDKNGKVVGKNNIRAQTEQVYANLKAVLKEAGGTIDNLVMTTTYLVDRKYRVGYNEVRMKQYGKNAPTSTLVICKGLAHPDYLIEISAIAVI